MAKVITKNVHERLDSFTYNETNDQYVQNTSDQQELIDKSKKKTIKKNTDGLIEKLDTKIYVDEDNRQLLND